MRLAMSYQARREQSLMNLLCIYRVFKKIRHSTIALLKKPAFGKRDKETSGSLLWPSGSGNNQIGLVSNKPGGNYNCR